MNSMLQPQAIETTPEDHSSSPALARRGTNLEPLLPTRAARIGIGNSVGGNRAMRLHLAPRGFTTRRIPDSSLAHVLCEGTPRPGDLVLARVDAMGQHTRLHLPNGRRRDLFEGDEIIVAYGNRYASDQFEARVPDTMEPCHLAASGGLAGCVVQSHRQLRRPTGLVPVGLIGRESDGPPVNVCDDALPELPAPSPGTIPTIAVVGTAMNAGKTTAAANLTRGLSRAGYRVGYVKVTGTSAGGDPWLLADAGATLTLDCVDAGLVTTYREPAPRVERACATLLGHAARAEVDLLLVEIADGVLQTETASLLESELARRQFQGVLFAASDAMGAALGAQWLSKRQHLVLAITGTLTNSPLQMAEAQAASGIETLPTSLLSAPLVAHGLLERTRLLR